MRAEVIVCTLATCEPYQSSALALGARLHELGIRFVYETDSRCEHPWQAKRFAVQAARALCRNGTVYWVDADVVVRDPLACTRLLIPRPRGIHAEWLWTSEEVRDYRRALGMMASRGAFPSQFPADWLVGYSLADSDAVAFFAAWGSIATDLSARGFNRPGSVLVSDGLTIGIAAEISGVPLFGDLAEAHEAFDHVSRPERRRWNHARGVRP